VSSTSNRLDSVGGALTRTYGYDNSGNTLSDGTATFTYNDAGRMVSATKTGVTTSYALNALGQRVKKTTAGASTYFAYDEAGHLIGEYSNTGNLNAETLWLDDTPVATLQPNGSGVDLFYIHSDHLNTPRRISRPSDDVVVWRWDSDPFGTTAGNEDPDGDSVLFAFNLRLPGQYFDAEAGLHYNYFRDYDPAVGGYVQSDPIGLWGGVNTYAYVQRNPIRYVDFFGLAIGDLPPPPPGYDPSTWDRGVWDSGRPYVRDPTTGDRWTSHPEDASHWRHWDKEDGGRWPPNSKKPWPNQKRGLKKDQCASDPSGDAPPWEPPPDLMVPWLSPEYLPRMPIEPMVSPRFRIPFRIPFVVP
jgi:RHS repeat-associated protein